MTENTPKAREEFPSCKSRLENLHEYATSTTFASTVQVIEHPNRKEDLVLIASADIPSGSTIFTEEAILSTCDVKATSYTPSLSSSLPFDWQRLLQQYLYLSDEKKELIATLSTAGVMSQSARQIDPTREDEWREGVRSWIRKKKGVTEDEMLGIVARIETNCHSQPLDRHDDVVAIQHSFSNEEDEEEHVGLFIIGSFMEHSCRPNATVLLEFEKGQPAVMHLRSITNIKKGELIQIAYVDTEYLPLVERQNLLAPRGFACSCGDCTRLDRFRTFVCHDAECGGPASVLLDLEENDDKNLPQNLMAECLVCHKRQIVSKVDLSSEQHLETEEMSDSCLDQDFNGTEETEENQILTLITPVLLDLQKTIIDKKPPSNSRATISFNDLPSLKTDLTCPLHPTHHFFYNFLKMNLFHNPYFPMILSEKHESLHVFWGCLYLVISSVGMQCGIEETRWNSLWMAKMGLELAEKMVTVCKDDCVDELMVQSIKDWSRWAAQFALNETEIAFGKESEEIDEVLELMESMSIESCNSPSR